MNYLLLLEILGSSFSILGAIIMSYSSDKNIKPLYFSNISYFLSNMFLLLFFSIHGNIPIVFQISIFMVLSILSITKYSNNDKRDKTIIYILLLFYFLIYIYILKIYNIENINYGVKIIDSIAAILAASGSYILLISKDNYKLRSYAYILYFIADILFVYIGLENAFYAFTIQSTIYIFTSIIAYYRTMNKEINKFFKR
jgi:hypothetical protein